MWWLAWIGVSLAAADDVCQPCHAGAAARFRASPMGRSLGPASVEAEVRFTHPPSGSVAQVRGTRQRLTRAGRFAEHEMAYTIGSGSHARGFLLRIGDALFQSPIAHYPKQGRWDAAPGYEHMEAIDFNRPVSTECLLCHTAGGEPRAISCQRCHGPAERHLREPRRETIVNPARLAATERDSVCEQCHLAGEARVANPGAALAGFQPGQRLEDVFSVYIYDRPRGDLRVISHVEQLALSACAIRSGGKLWCGTCHSAHSGPIAIQRRCQGCHAAAHTAAKSVHADCTGCHMPKRKAADGAHTAFTDHRITRGGVAASLRPAGLKAWRQPPEEPLRQRNLGLALLAVGERDRVPAQIDQGYKLLLAAYPRFPKDADVLAGIGMVLFLKDQHADAAKLLRAAIAVRPNDAALHERLATVLRAAGDRGQAAAALETAIALDPSRESAYHLLQGIRPESRALERYLRWNPQSLLAREALAQLPR